MDFLSQFDVLTQPNPPERWALAAGIFLVVIGLVWVLLYLVRHRLRSLSEGTDIVLDDLVVAVLSKTKKSLVAVFALRFAIDVLVLPDSFDRIALRLATLALLVQIGIWFSAGLEAWIESYQKERAGEGDVATWLGGMQWLGRFAIWTLVLLVALENLGVDITGLATGLGIGGIAVALAVQSILGDLFASFSIYLDRPFVIGDSLKVGGDVGTVESIGLKTTRLRSPSGEQLVISNADLLKSRIHNFGRMVERRVVFEIGVTFGTSAERIESIPKMMREIVEGQSDVRFDRSHFKAIGESSLIIETVFFMQTSDYLAYLDVQQAINLELLRRLGDEGIELALPASTVRVIEGEA